MQQRSKLYDLVTIGTAFNKLTVIGPLFRVRAARSIWRTAKLHCVCECQCGKVAVYSAGDLVRGGVKSCGCHRIQMGRTLGLANRKHGGEGTNIYDRWHNMKLRCYDPGQANFNHYGGRGVEVCDEWREDFAAFREWAFANGYSPKLQIDRIDVNGNYEPSNCRWVTNQENSNNRRNTIIVEWQGESKSLADWARDVRCLVSRQTLWQRYSKDGWPFGLAMSTPPIPRGTGRLYCKQRNAVA